MLLKPNFFVFGCGLAACVTALIYCFSGDFNQGISKTTAALNSLRIIESGLAPSTDHNDKVQQIINSGQLSRPPGDTTSTYPLKWPKVQQIINSGQLSRPPGDTASTYSLKLPFVKVLRATESGSVPDGNQNVNIGPVLQGIDPPRSVNLGMTALTISPKEVSKIAGNAKQPFTESQPIEFETPPGIGSVKGGP